jgi:DNA helicase-2/ATP-dependent DNA helicase PcrA
MMEELVDVEKMADDVDEDMRFLGRLVMRYRELLEKKNSMDFSSIQTDTWKLLTENEEVCKAVQDKIRYVMVDEYQDTNYIQEQLVFKIVGDKKNLCVVGDDDQGMYRFRGATIRNILEFPDKFEKDECQVIHLNDNYRSEPGIINFYNNWMESVEGINLFNWDKYRYPKQIRAKKSNVRPGVSVYACGGDSIDIEKQELLEMIQRLISNGNVSNLNQIAFLFKSVKSNEATEIAEYLEANGIPVYSPRSDMFFERKEVKQLLGCIMFCFNQYMSDLKNNMFRYPISKELREYYISCRAEAITLLKEDAGLKEYISNKALEIINLKEDTDSGLLDILYRIVSFEPFKGYLQSDLKQNVVGSRAARNLSEISRMIAKYCFLHDMHLLTVDNKNEIAEQWFNLYLKYLYIDGIGEYEDESEYAPSGCVSFMTIHQSKGLEFPVVVVGSLGSVPRKNSDALMYTAESRFFNRQPYEPMANIKFFDFWRLYYVAFSRAQNLLVLATKREDGGYFGEQLCSLPKISEFEDSNAFENVKSVKYKHVYSFTSHIGLYDGCPTQYKYYKEYGFAQNKMFHTSVGSLVHATLEDVNKCIINGHIEQVDEEVIKEWFALNYRSMQEQTGYFLTDEQSENALSQVIRYYRHRKDELGRVWKAEEEINLVLPEYILQGTIDLVEGDGNVVEIVDYKTGSKPNVSKPERVAHYKKQLEIYAYLIEKRYRKKVSRMHLYYTSTMEGNPIISFEWSRDAVNETIDEITQTVRNIEDKNFNHMVQNSYACEFCDMRYVCGK